MNHLSSQKIKQKHKTAAKAFFGLFLGVYAFTSTLAFFIVPKEAKASGDTEYGKWYTTDEIVFKSSIQVAGTDGVWSTTPFVRVGADSGSFKVKITVSADKPDSLTFAPTQKIGNPNRDGVRGPNKLANNTFYENIWPLEGIGAAYNIGGVKQGDKDGFDCTWKDVKRLWRFWESSQEIKQCPVKGQTNNDEMSGTFKAGDELYNNGPGFFAIGPNELKELTFRPGKTYALVVWPQLRVNTGDTTLTEAIVATGIDTAAGTLAVKFGQPVAGVIGQAYSKLADIKSGKTTVSQVVSDIVKTTPGMPEAEVKAAAEATLKRMMSLSDATVITDDLITAATKNTIAELTAAGFNAEKAETVATLHLKLLAEKAGADGPKLLNVAGRVVESGAISAGVEKTAANFGSRVAGKVSTILGSKWIPVVGWVWLAVDIAFYLDTFSTDSLPLYPSNASKVWVQVYSTQAQADAAKNDPIPPEIAEEIAKQPLVRTGSPAQTNQEMSGLTKLVSDLIITISQFFITMTYKLFYNIVVPMLEGLLSIRVYTDQFVNVIYPGWEILRNVSNIYFIIAIIAIALATLFRVESYKYKHLLVQLMIAALTVNFSLVIGQAVLGVADTVQNQFLPNNAAVIKQLGKDLMPNRIQEIITSSKFASGSFFATASASLFFMSLAFGSFLVFAAILYYLVVRMVMIWILLMLSPLAYAAGVLPSTANLRGKWWQEFLKYAFFTPIMAFFMNMAALIAVNYEFVFRDINSSVATNAQWGGFATLVFAVASNMMLLVFLFAAINLAQQFGIFGADVVDKVVKGGIFAPFAGAGAAAGLAGKGAKALVGRGFEGLQNITGITMDPRQWAAKWKEYNEREKQKRLEKRADQDVGLPGLRIKGSAKLGLGSPLDFYKNFANWQGVKRIGRRLGKSADSAFKDMKRNEKDLNLLKKEASVLSEADFDETTAKYAEANKDFSDAYQRAKDLTKDREDLKTELSGLDSDIKRLTSLYKAAATEDEKKKIKQDLDVAEQEQARLRAQIQEKVAALERMGLMYDNDGNEKKDEYKEGSVLGKSNDLKIQLKNKLDKDKEIMDGILADPKGASFSRFTNDDAKEAFVSTAVKDANKKWMDAQADYYAREIPKAYHARAARQHLEAEEEKKVADIKNWPEKVQVFLTAQAEQNPYLAAAALKSLAKDSNFNEITEALGYDSSAEGLKRFFEEQYRDKFGLTQHQMMEVATEVGYINEDTGWWNMARVSQIDKHGHLNWQIDTDGKWKQYLESKLGRKLSEDDLVDYKPVTQEEYDLKWGPQNHEISVEMEKRGPRLIANFARTSFVNQTLGPEGHMSTGIHRAGWKILNSMSKTPNMRYEFSRMLRPNTAQAIAMVKEWTWAECQKHGVDREIYEKVCQMGGKAIKD